MRLLVCGGAVVLAALGGILALGPSAGANPPGPHDPIGSVTAVRSVTGGLQFTGWALDPDARKANVTIAVVLDGGTVAASGPTSVANATVTSKYSAGVTPGFVLTAPVPSGAHTACLAALSIGPGVASLLKCVPTPLGSTLTRSQLATHQARGAITRFAVGSSSLRVTGWAADPDWLALPVTVVLYVDGNPAATVVTVRSTGTRPAAAGPNSAFDITVPVSTGTHIGCVWVVNIGLGSGNTGLGCTAGDTRGRAGSGPVTTPALNAKVLAEAKRHIGQRYVWGAAGPKTFDCSGLVKYSYGKFGYTTPRVSEAQALAARLIPASRAVPGDLVFTHDSEGDVYHVGIYVSPGKAVAAIDEQEGVNYQSIWDPAATTYGSFTHT